MVNGVEIAERFHAAYERLASTYGYETRRDTKTFDPASSNGRLMTAVCQEIGNQIEREAFDAGFQAGLHVAVEYTKTYQTLGMKRPDGTAKIWR